jgi:hypothetical protein
MTNITFTAIKKYTKNMSREQLIDELKVLYNLFPDVKKYYQSKLTENGENELLEKYKKVIKNEFFPKRGFGKARLSIAKKAVLDFDKFSRNKINTADIMVFYVEQGIKFTNAYGDIDESFYYSMESMYDKASKFIKKHNIETNFLTRLHKMIDDTSEMGWGFHDTLDEIFHEYFCLRDL